MEQVIEIHGVCKHFPGFSLGPLSFSLPRGYVMAVIGPNGAGKSTLIKLLLNLLQRDSGDIRIFGHDNVQEEESIKQRIGFVHEVPRFYAHLTVEKLKRLVAPFYPSWDEQKFQSLADSFDLPGGRRFGRLSRGMKMKASLAFALSHDAELLILDEPTSGLDPVFRHSLLEQLRALLQNEGRSILFSSQITSDVERIADYVTYLRCGQVVFSSSLDRVRESWGVVRGDVEMLDAEARRWFRGYVAQAYGFQGLTDNIEEARRRFHGQAVVERASIEDILFLMEGRQSWSASEKGTE